MHSVIHVASRLITPLNERFTLLGYHRGFDDDPYFAVRDGNDNTLQMCGDAFFSLGREDPDGGDDPPPRRFYAVNIPEWRMAIACTSDSDQVISFGSRKGGTAQRWQRWVLPDEEGPPAIPPFESADGDVFEDQFIVGLALDRTNTERLTLIAGEEKFPPSPVVWGLTSHGSLLAWTALHKKAPATNGAYTFMQAPSPLPALSPLS